MVIVGKLENDCEMPIMEENDDINSNEVVVVETDCNDDSSSSIDCSFGDCEMGNFSTTTESTATTVQTSGTSTTIAVNDEMKNPKNMSPKVDLKRMFAYMKLQRLLKEHTISDSNSNALIAKIIKLAKNHQFVTKFTSMVVTENDNDEIKLERLRFRQFSTHRTRPNQKHNYSLFHNMVPKVANAPPSRSYIPMRSRIQGQKFGRPHSFGRVAAIPGKHSSYSSSYQSNRVASPIFPSYRIRQSHRRMGGSILYNRPRLTTTFPQLHSITSTTSTTTTTTTTAYASRKMLAKMNSNSTPVPKMISEIFSKMNSRETFTTKIFYKIGLGSGFYYLSSRCDLILTADSSLSMPVKFSFVAGKGVVKIPPQKCISQTRFTLKIKNGNELWLNYGSEWFQITTVERAT